jgi:formate hydrogenlyase subunit 4
VGRECGRPVPSGRGSPQPLPCSVAPVTGFVRKAKARLLRRQGPPIIQPYRDLLRLMKKEVVLANNASWLFRACPYLIFAATWVAAALVPTFATGLIFSWSADLIAIVALLGLARHTSIWAAWTARARIRARPRASALAAPARGRQ